ncbi:hypothetical protein [Trinickia mobilis]|uniref:hypothetical protein n=1 Tax=Trinickia mobilis TaxID=2816356 RepID=UPI001A8EC34E|nr:hypothetical protein [Trinickia mobilis]
MSGQSLLPAWLSAAYGIRDAKLHKAVLPIYPPKRRIDFSLDGIRYEAPFSFNSGMGPGDGKPGPIWV